MCILFAFQLLLQPLVSWCLALRTDDKVYFHRQTPLQRNTRSRSYTAAAHRPKWNVFVWLQFNWLFRFGFFRIEIGWMLKVSSLTFFGDWHPRTQCNSKSIVDIHSNWQYLSLSPKSIVSNTFCCSQSSARRRKVMLETSSEHVKWASGKCRCSLVLYLHRIRRSVQL